jgi:hypothetical protein
MTDWRNSAACRDMDPRDFDDQGTPVAWEACQSCDVVEECLVDALEAADPPTHDVYRGGRAFGTTANRYRPKPYTQAKCGTEAGYYRHRRVLFEPPCLPCKAAHNAAKARRDARASA